MNTLSFFFEPHFVIRYYLRSDIKETASAYHFQKKILDVGCGVKPYRKLFRECEKYVGIDFPDYSKNKGYKHTKPERYFNKQYLKTMALPFAKGSFDNTVSFQVLEHHKDPIKLISEIVRVTKKNGYILITAPFIWGLHEEPDDYARFTEYFFKGAFRKYGCNVLFIKKEGSVFSVFSCLATDYLIELAGKNKLNYFIAIFFYPIFLFGSYCSFFLDRVFKSDKIFLNYLILAQKR